MKTYLVNSPRGFSNEITISLAKDGETGVSKAAARVAIRNAYLSAGYTRGNGGRYVPTNSGDVVNIVVEGEDQYLTPFQNLERI